MLLADECQRLADEWPSLPAANDTFVMIPPIASGHIRAVPGAPLEIVYVTTQTDLVLFAVRRRAQ